MVEKERMIETKPITIAIGSGKGGTGKTLLSTNLFYALQEQGHRVTLVDCDAEEPNDMIFFKGTKQSTIDVTQRVPVIDESKCTYCGKCHEYCSYKAIFIIPPAKVIKVMEELCHGCGACLYACKYNAITEKDSSLGEITTYGITEHSSIIENRMHIGVYSPVSIIKKGISQADTNHTVLLDAPPGTSCSFIQTAARSDYVILITEPTPFGYSDLKQSVETLKDMDKPIGVVINRAGIGNNEVYQYLEENNIPLLLEIPFDKQIAKTYSKGDLVAKDDKQLREQLLNLFNQINKKYGNSSN